MSQAPETIRWNGLQCLRAVAASLILWAHLKFAVGEDLTAHFAWIGSAAGAIGVDVFFVISGFVISLVASSKESDWRRFVVNRFARVVPYYWLVSLAIWLPKLAHREATDPAQVWNSFAFLPVWDVHGYTNPLHPYGWSLGFEIWFYLLFGTLLATVRKQAHLVLVPLLSLGVLSVLFVFPYGNWILPRFLFSPMVLEFCLGVVIYRFRNRIPEWVLWPSLLATGVLFAWVLKTESLGLHLEVLVDPVLGFQRVAIWGGFAVFLALSAILADRRILKGRWPRWFVSLGDASYSLYLVQPLVLLAVRKFVPESFSLLRGVLFVAASFAVAPLVWRRVEIPLTASIRRRLESLFLSLNERA
jgi:exopolysaccharide production protein ExoZ